MWKPKTVARVIEHLESRIAPRSNARDLRRRYIFRWRLTRCLQIPRAYARMHVCTYVRTHACIRPGCLPVRSIVCTGAILFYNRQKAIETDRRVTSAVTAETPFCMSDNTLFIPEKSLRARAYVCNWEWGTELWANRTASQTNRK